MDGYQYLRVPFQKVNGIWTVNLPTWEMISCDEVAGEAIVRVPVTDLPDAARDLKGSDQADIGGKTIRIALSAAGKADWDKLLASRYPGKSTYSTVVK